MTEDNNCFFGDIDRYNGVTIYSQKEPCELQDLTKKLQDSLNKWKADKKRCIWFKVNIKDSAWVPILAGHDFNFHHARDDFVMMFRWLPTDSTCNLPPACHTNLGVGAIVFNDKNEMLVVSEHHYEYPHWKLPGGYVERGEDIRDAAIREVKEETGIDAKFVSMITLRHTHKMMFGNSDIYIVVKLQACSDVIAKCDNEINACKWMEIDEFLNHDHVHEFNRFLVRQALDLDTKQIKLNLLKASFTIAKFTREITTLTLENSQV